NGSTGEGTSLTLQERKNITEKWVALSSLEGGGKRYDCNGSSWWNMLQRYTRVDPACSGLWSSRDFRSRAALFYTDLCGVESLEMMSTGVGYHDVESQEIMSLRTGYHDDENHGIMSLRTGYHDDESHGMMSLRTGYDDDENHGMVSPEVGYHDVEIQEIMSLWPR
ncbi:hypothetical protein RRG08_051128, partial [Elysia crispata]